MTTRTKASLTTILLIIAISSLPIPVSASSNSFPAFELTYLSSFVDTKQNKNEQPGILRELQIEDLTPFPITQQPSGNVTFVSSLKDYVTEFQIASSYGTVGLLAHNYLAGQYFFQILPGQEVALVYSDKRTQKFTVIEIQKYQALAPESPTSDFIDLATGKVLTAYQVFKKTYGSRPGRLILQTCIYGEQNPSWGRLFIIAQPVEQTSGEE